MALKAVLLLTAVILAVSAQRTVQPSCGTVDIVLLVDNPYSGTIQSYVSQLLGNFGGQFRVFGVHGLTDNTFHPSVATTEIKSITDMNAWGDRINNEGLTTSSRIGKRTFLTANELLNNLTSTASRRIVVAFFSNTPQDDYPTLISGSRVLKENPKVPTEVYVIRIFGGSSNDNNLRKVASPGFQHFVENGDVQLAEWVQSLFTSTWGETLRASCHIGGYPSRVSTFDGASYSFPGMGDYWLLKDTNNQIQVRMGDCFSPNPTSGAGSCLRAVSINGVNFYYEAAQNLIFVQSGNNVANRRSYDNDGCSSLNGVSFCSAEISIPGTSETSIYFYAYVGNMYLRAVFSRNLPTHVILDISGETSYFGITQGLCGVWDGCAAADLYSRDQKFSAVGDASGIYNSFTESWRVLATDTKYFTEGVNEEYDAPEIASRRSPNFSPKLSTEYSPEATEDCAVLARASSYFYQVCLESSSNGYPGVRDILLLILSEECLYDVCDDYPDTPDDYSLDRVINLDYCLARCRAENDLDFEKDYVNEVTDPLQQEDIRDVVEFYQDEFGANLFTPIGGRYTVALKNDFCDEQVVGRVDITCDYTPSVNAGADRVVKRGAYGWPYIFLTGSASDVNTDKLQYRWRFIDWPKAGNSSETQLNPVTGYPPASNPNGLLWWTNQQFTAFNVPYPGTYVLSLTVFDGCSFSNDTVSITVTCEDCSLTASGTPLTDFNPYDANSIVQTTQTSVYDYPYSVDSRVYMQSNSHGHLTLNNGLDSSTKDVYLIERTYENEIGENRTYEDISVTPDEDTDNEPLENFTGLYGEVRYEGTRHTVTSTVTTYVTTEDTIYYDSIDQDIYRCHFQFQNQLSSTSSNIRLVTDYGYSTGQRIHPTRWCLGDYVARKDFVESNKNCGQASVELDFSVKCGATPRAHLTTCVNRVEYDYVNSRFPDVELDARDSSDTDTGRSSLYLQYVVENRPSSDYTLSGGSGVCTNCFTKTLTPQAEGLWDITLWVSDTCTNSNDTVSFETICRPVTPSFPGVTFNDASGPIFNEVTLDGTGSTITNGTISYLWSFVGYPTSVLADSSLLPQFVSSNQIEEPTIRLYRRGAYQVMLVVGDGCGFRSVNGTVTYTCIDTVTARAVVDPTTSVFDGTANLPSVTLNATTSTVNATRANYQWNVVSAPEGVIINTNTWTSAVRVFTPPQVGTYQFTVTVDDDCDESTSTPVTVTASCPTIPAITAVGSTETSYTINRPDETTVYVELVATHQSALPTGAFSSWTVTDPAGTVVTLNETVILNPSFYASMDGVYHVAYSAQYNANGVGVGCTQVVAANATFTVGCGLTTNVNPFPTQTVTFSRGKFPRVSFDTVFTVTGDYPVDSLASGTWIVESAPADSVFYAVYNNMSSTFDTLVNQTTPATPTQIGDNLWTRVRRIETEEVQTSVTSYVILDNIVSGDSSASSRFSACFTPDREGQYTLRYENVDFCGGRVFTQTATVNAVCNTRPVAAVTNPTVTADFNRNGYTRVKLDGSASHDTDEGDSIVWVRWSLISFPSESTLNGSATPITNADKLVASFQPDIAGTYIFELVVSDGCSLSDPVTVTVTVSCSSGATLLQPSISYVSNGYTPISLTHFTLTTRQRCDFEYYWEIVDYVAPPHNNYAPPQEEDTSSGQSLAISSLFGLICVIIAIFF